MSVSRVFRLPMLFTLRERVLSAMLRSGGAVRALVCSFAKTRQSVSGAGIESMRGLQRLSCRGTFQPRIGGRSSPKSSARRICNGIARPVNAATPTTFRGNGGSKSRLFLSALATLGVGTRGIISMLGTSMASTVAVAVVMPQGAGALCVAGRGSDDEDKGKDDLKVLLKIAKDTLFGDVDHEEGGSGAKAAKERRNKDRDNDKDNVNKFMADLAGAVKDFGGEFTKAVDGAVQRKIKPDRDEGPMKAFRDKINEVMGSGAPAQMSFGFLMGICCGFAAKKTAKVAVVGVGLAFGSLQILSYLGYVELDYRKIEDEVMGALDIDSDGKVDSNDIKEVFDRVMKVAAHNLPAGSGFTAGAIVGVRMG